MDGSKIIILSEVNHTEKDKYHTMSLICGILYICICVCIHRYIYIDMHTNELIYKIEIDPQMQKRNLCLPKGKESGEG